MCKKHKKTGLIFAVLLGLLAAFSASAESQTFTKNKIGKSGEFDFELWRDKGEALMTVNDDGTFSCEWDKEKTGNVLFRTGKKFNSTQTHEEIGTFSLEYGADYVPPNGASYLSIYGWSVDPLVEFYIVESFGTYNPGSAGTYKGTVTIDGDDYKLYESTRVNQPSIKGNTTFEQYWSIRENKRTAGTIPITEHFKAWEEAGMVLGKMYEVSLVVEGYHTSGTADIYKNVLTYGDTTIGSVKEEALSEPEEAAEEPVATDEAVVSEESAMTSDESAAADVSSVTDSESSNFGTAYILIIGVVVIAVICVIIVIRITRKK